MSDTSTETKTQGEAKVEKTEAKVPVQAVAEARAEKRAAQSEAERLKQELEQLKQSQSIDVNALMEQMQQVVNSAVDTAVATALAPAKAEAERYKLGMKLGLSEEQASAVFEIQSQLSGIAPEEAVLIAKTRQPDLFPQQPVRQGGFDPRLHGAVPAVGAAQLPGHGPKTYQQQKEELLKRGASPDEVKGLAVNEIQRIIQSARIRAPSS